MFKKTMLAISVAVMAMGSVSVMAEDEIPTGTDVGLITFDGAVTDTTCKITTNNGVDANNVTITMPVVKKADLELATIDAGIGSKEFELHLTDCPTTLTKASATFTSQQFADLTNGTLKADPTVSAMQRTLLWQCITTPRLKPTVSRLASLITIPRKQV